MGLHGQSVNDEDVNSILKSAATILLLLIAM
jgi:hypothetical protein